MKTPKSVFLNLSFPPRNRGETQEWAWLPFMGGIIRNHSGYIQVESKPGIGTSFMIYLPPSNHKSGRRDAEKQTAGFTRAWKPFC